MFWKCSKKCCTEHNTLSGHVLRSIYRQIIGRWTKNYVIYLKANLNIYVLLQIITNLTITINEAQFKDRGELLQILQGSSHEKKGSSYIVTGTYEELLKLFNRLSAVVESHRSIPGMHGGNYPQNKHASTHVKSMKVSGIVMSYIMQKRSEELNKILGNSFIIETQPDMGAVHINPTSTVQVQVRECPVPVIHTPAEFVRQRFTSFYQRTASDLQVITVSVGADDRKDLQADFPDILFIPSHNKHDMTVTGPFVHIAELKELMKRSSSRRQVPQGPAVPPKKRTPCSSPTGNEDSEGESCLICMEPIVTTEKETLRCKHSFCKNCLKKAFEYKPVCPTCGEIYGVLRGTQPDGGEMDVTESSSSLPGYEKYGTIIVKYYIPSGIQTVRLQMQHPTILGSNFTNRRKSSGTSRSNWPPWSFQLYLTTSINKRSWLACVHWIMQPEPCCNTLMEINIHWFV